MLEGSKEMAACCWETGLLGYRCFHREAAAKLLFPSSLSASSNCCGNPLAQQLTLLKVIVRPCASPGK